MKYFILFSLVFLVIENTNAQNRNDIYKARLKTEIQAVNPINYKDSRNTVDHLEQNMKFEIIQSIDDENFLIKVLPFKIKCIPGVTKLQNAKKNSKLVYGYSEKSIELIKKITDGEKQENINYKTLNHLDFDEELYFSINKNRLKLNTLLVNGKKQKRKKNTKLDGSNDITFDFKDFTWRDSEGNILDKFWIKKKGELINLYVKNRNPQVYTVGVKLTQSEITFPFVELEKIDNKNNPSKEEVITNSSFAGNDNTQNKNNDTTKYEEFEKKIIKLNTIVHQHYIDDANRALISEIALTTPKFLSDYTTFRKLENTPKKQLKEFVDSIKVFNELLLNIGKREFVETFVIEEDFVDVELEMLPVKNDKKNTLIAKKSKFGIQRKGVMLSFSSGLAASGSFYNNVFYRGSEGSIQTAKSDHVIPSVVTLLHVHFLNKSTHSGGFSFGTGIPLTAKPLENVEFYFGGSYFIGPRYGNQRQRFVISGGLKIAPTTVLANGNKLYDPIPVDFDFVSNTRKEYRPGWFLSFTYNFVNQQNKLQFVNF